MALDQATYIKLLREASGYKSQKRKPVVGDIVEVFKDGVSLGLGICTDAYKKGYCSIGIFDIVEGFYPTSYLDFITDEERHGPDDKTYVIRDDLAEV